MGSVPARPAPARHGTYATAGGSKAAGCNCEECVAYRRRPDGWGHDPEYADEVMIERAVDGEVHHTELTIVEKYETIRRLLKRGKSIRKTAAHLGMSDRQVLRIKKALTEAEEKNMGLFSDKTKGGDGARKRGGGWASEGN